MRRQGERYFAADGLRDISGDRRLAILAVCVVEWRAAIADAVVETHDRIVGKTWREAKQLADTRIDDAKTTLPRILRTFTGLGAALLEAQNRVVCGRGRNTTISESAGPCGRLKLDFAPQTAAYAAVGPVRRPRCQRPKGIFRPCSRRVEFGSPPRQILHSTPNQRNPARRSRRRDAYRSISPPPANDPRIVVLAPQAPCRGYVLFDKDGKSRRGCPGGWPGRCRA